PFFYFKLGHFCARCSFELGCAHMARVRVSLNHHHDLQEFGVQGPCWIVGADEVGARCLAVPLYSAAVGCYVGPDSNLEFTLSPTLYVHDSKKLKANDRKLLKEFVATENFLLKEWVEVSPAKIDEVNILRARLGAMAEGMLRVVAAIVARGYRG